MATLSAPLSFGLAKAYANHPWSVTEPWLAKNEKVCQWEEHLCQCLFSHTFQKAQLRAPLSPLQTAWTGFDPNLYSSGSSSAGPALVEIATAMSATPLEPGW